MLLSALDIISSTLSIVISNLSEGILELDCRRFGGQKIER